MEKKRTIGSLLMEYGFISEAELDDALKRQQETGRRIGEILVESGKVTQQDIEWILSKQLDIPYIIPDEQSLDIDLISRFPRELLVDNRILPMHETEDEIAIATDDPFNTAAFEAVSRQAGNKQVVLSACDSETLESILNKVYRREAVPELTDLLRGIIEQIRDTSFYRLDFHLEEFATEVHVFGAGVLKLMHRSETVFQPEDVLKALNALRVRYLYDEFHSSGHVLLQIFPLDGEVEVRGYPMVLGSFGLGLPQGVLFTDAKADEVPAIFRSPAPVAGYNYLALKACGSVPGRMLYSIDSVPPGFPLYYVHAHKPSLCQCRGDGCAECKGLGYVFERFEGMFTYEDIMKALSEGLHAED